MSELRTFKAQKGKVLYCLSGDIVFSDGFYATDKEDEITSILKGVGIEEVTNTIEAKEKPVGKKRPVISKEDKEKNKKADEKKKADTKAEEEKTADESGKPQANGVADVEDLGDDEDIEVMPKPRCIEILTKAGIVFKPSDGVNKLRELVEKLK